MPELPEVEIVRQSLSKNIKGKKINQVLVRNRNLRFRLKHSFELSTAFCEYCLYNYTIFF